MQPTIYITPRGLAYTSETIERACRQAMQNACVRIRPGKLPQSRQVSLKPPFCGGGTPSPASATLPHLNS